MSESSEKIRIEIYSKAECPLCDKAKEVLLSIQNEFNFVIFEIDITADVSTYEKFKEQIPVVFINGRKAFKYRIDPEDLRKKLQRIAN